MLSPFWKFLAVAAILISISKPVVAEDPARSEPARTDLTELPFLPHPRPLTRSSGYIFAGTVKSVERAAAKGHDVATVLINFHVDQAMRGVQAGQTLAIREWAGLWESGERYRKGEQVLLFLYPPSKLGLTSPVGGALGRFPIGRDGQVALYPRIGVPVRRTGGEFMRVSPREVVRYFRDDSEE